MPEITMHLAANFYPPIPHDIQLSVQEFFDKFVEEANPYILGWKGLEDDWEYEISNEDALEMEWELPNGRIVKAQHMLDELRLWDAVWWDCEEPQDLCDIESDEDLNLYYSESQEIPGQLEMNYDSPV